MLTNPYLNVGDDVLLRHDVLAEVARVTPGGPVAWRFLEAGTRCRLIGWRDREDASRAVLDVAGTDKRLVVFVSDRHVSRQ